MAERKIQVPTPEGKMVDGMDVPIERSDERWSEFTLEDGTVIRAKINIASAVRVDGQYDTRGQPVYILNTSPTVSIINVPERLKRRFSKMDIPIEPTTTEAYIANANILHGMKGVWGVASSEEDAVPSEPYRIMDFIIQTVGGAATTNTPTYPFFPDWFRFQELISQWRRERGATSSITKMAMCPSYQRIIAMGKEPFL